MDRKKSYQKIFRGKRIKEKKRKKQLPKITLSQSFLLSKQFEQKEKERSKKILPQFFILVNKIFWAKNKRLDFLKKKSWLIMKNILNNNCANTIFANKRNISYKEIVCHRHSQPKKYKWTR